MPIQVGTQWNFLEIVLLKPLGQIPEGGAGKQGVRGGGYLLSVIYFLSQNPLFSLSPDLCLNKLFTKGGRSALAP